MREAASGILVLMMLVPVPFLSPHLVAQQQGIHVPYLEDLSSIPGWGRSPGDGKMGKWQPAPVFLPEKSHGQRSLVGYSPKGQT